MKPSALPPPRPVVHALRSVETAVTSFTVLPGHRRRLTIDHQPLAGLTPELLLWWFRHLGDRCSYGGAPTQNYLAWHPLDHIQWELVRPGRGGGADEGARFRIVEAFQRRPEFMVDSTETVDKLDETGIRLVRWIAGVQVLQLEHTWSRCDGHVHYVSVLEVGARSRALTPVNRYLRRSVFPDDMARAWLRHNVEEVGHLEHVLPAAFAAATADDRALRACPASSPGATVRP